MRVLIAEDSALLRAGVERILTDAGHDVIAGVPDATNLLRLVNDKRPDLAIVDVRMPPTFTDEGIQAAALLRSQNPESPVLVLSHYVEERYAADLIASDTKGFGYLLKDRVADVPAFLDAVEVVGGGGAVLDPEVVSQILVRSHRRSALDQLTPREREVLQLMAEGKTEAAPRTVDAPSENGDVVIALPARGPYVVNANTENGDTSIRVPRATNRENALAVVTVRPENGDVVVDDLR